MNKMVVEGAVGVVEPEEVYKVASEVVGEQPEEDIVEGSLL